MSSRYRKRNIFLNQDDVYTNQFKNRGIKSIKHYSTANFRYPTADELEGVKINIEIFKIGDRFYKYAQKYYGDSSYWWVIAYFNQKPTENMINVGDTIYIPTPLTRMLEIFES
jgi:hypothetical protein